MRATGMSAPSPVSVGEFRKSPSASRVTERIRVARIGRMRSGIARTV